MFLIINNPAAAVKTVFVVGRVDENYFGGVFCIVDKGVGFPLEGLDGRI